MSHRKNLSLSLSFILCLAMAVLVMLSVAGLTYATSGTRYVATNGTDRGTCTSPGTPCRTIQYAVNVAGSGDVVKVAAGEYSGVQIRPAPPGYPFPPSGGIQQVVYVDKTITLRGGYLAPTFSDPPDPPSHLTTLNARGQGRALVIVGSIQPTIQGLRFTGGDASGLGGGAEGLGGDVGGGGYILGADAIFIDNEVYANTVSGRGGGLYLQDSASLLSGNIITDNYAEGGGLFLYNSPATLEDNTISANHAMHSGGGLTLYLCDGATLTRNDISDNGGDWALRGGGLSLVHSHAILTDNTIARNAAYEGGGLYTEHSGVILAGNVVSGNAAIDVNFAGDDGGGAYFYGGQAVLNDNLFFGNRAGDSGGALYFDYGQVTLQRNALLRNSTVEGDSTTGLLGGGGIYLHEGSVSLDGDVILNNTSLGHGGGVYLYRGDAVLSNDVVAGNLASGHGGGFYTHAASPRFFHLTLSGNGGGGGLYVQAGSPVLSNTIIVSETVGVYCHSSGTIWLYSTLWGAGEWANGEDWAGPGVIYPGIANYWGDPGFIDADYHIGPESAALDRGAETSVRWDLDVQPRSYHAPDLGADEYWPPGVLKHIHLPLVLCHAP